MYNEYGVIGCRPELTRVFRLPIYRIILAVYYIITQVNIMFDYQNSSLTVEQRTADLLSRMTLEEKVAQTCMMRGVEYATKPEPRQHCSVQPDTEFDSEKLSADFGKDGIGFIHDMYSTPPAFNRIQRYFIEHSRLGIPVIFTGEALHGISGIRGTVFPCPLNLGATFDPELVYHVGEAIGRETRSLGMHEILAPNLDVARESRWGRVEETFGEDTYLSSRMAAAAFFPHWDEEDFAVSYDAFAETVLYEGKGRRSKKREAALLDGLQDAVDEAAASLDAQVFWDKPLGGAQLG